MDEEAQGRLPQQRVSGPTAALVIFLALAVFVILFGRSSFAPPEEPPFVLPFEPPVDNAEVAAMRQGLEPLGVSVVMPPLVEDRLRGVRIAWVRPGGPAEAAGLRPGDLVVKFNGRDIPYWATLVVAVNQTRPQAKYPVVVVRDGERKELTVTGLKPLPPEELDRLLMGR